MSNKTKYKALLNNCVDDDDAILYQREIDNDIIDIIKEYLKFYKRCLAHEKRDFKQYNHSGLSENFYRGKIYEMELVIKDLQRILDGDIFFKEGDING